MTDEAVKKIIRELEMAGYKITPPPEPPPERFCSRCGLSEDETDWLVLLDITVKTCIGEEGFSAVENLYCDECFSDVCDGLMALGFVSHRHGTTSSLEDMDCPGAENYGTCPNPTDESEWDI
jgi:hypothetical protein